MDFGLDEPSLGFEEEGGLDWGRELDGAVGQPCPEAHKDGLVVEGNPGEDGEGEGELNECYAGMNCRWTHLIIPRVQGKEAM